MENEIYKKVIEIVENCMSEMGYIMRPHADETDDFLIELEKDLNEKLPLPSVSREKAEEVLNKHSGVMLYKDTIIADNQQYYSRDFCISLMLEFATPSPQSPEPSDHKTYYCSVCHKVPVDAENGFDTCFDCVSKI